MRRGYAIQPMDSPAVTVVVPTRGRAAYLEVTLDSLRRQRTRTPHELLVVDDGATDATPEVAERFGVRLIRHGERRSLNAARNTGVREAARAAVAFVDDDVLVPPGWLDALVEGAARHPDAEAFGGPIRPRFEGHAPRGCGREDPPITTLDLGPRGRGGGDGVGRELRRAPLGGRAGRRVRREPRPLPRRRGGLAPAPARRRRPDRLPGRRRPGPPAQRGRLAASARSRAPPTTAAAARARATCAAGAAPRLARELRVLAGCGWHTRPPRLPAGRDHGRALGRPRHGGAAPAVNSDAARSGLVPLRRRRRRDRPVAARPSARLGELAYGALDTLSGTRRRRGPPRAHGLGTARRARDRRVPAGLAAAPRRCPRCCPSATTCASPSARPGRRTAAARAHGRRGPQRRQVREPQPGARGRPAQPATPTGRSSSTTTCAFRAPSSTASSRVCEAFELDLAQPAQTLRSHSAWKVTRRRPASLVRETRFVEIGPVTAFGRAAAAELLPFPELRYGWGLDLHWAALAAERGWRLGVVDALPVRHEFGLVAAALLARGRRGRGRPLPRRAALPAERPRRRGARRAPEAEVLTCGCCSSAPTCAPVEPSATGRR